MDISAEIKYLEDLKVRVEFYSKGAIVPQRVLKSERRKKHLVTFGSDSWLVPTRSGYLVLVDCGGTGSALTLRGNLSNAHLCGSPYSGNTHWLGNCRMSESEYASKVARELARLNGETDS